MGGCASSPAAKQSKKTRKPKKNVVTTPAAVIHASSRTNHLPPQLCESVYASPLPEIEVEKRPILENTNLQPASVPDPTVEPISDPEPTSINDETELIVTLPNTLPVLTAETLKVPVFDHMHKPIRIVQTNPLFEVSERSQIHEFENQLYDDDDEDYELAHRVEFIPTSVSKQQTESSQNAAKLKRSYSDNVSESSNFVFDRDVDSIDSKSVILRENSPASDSINNSEMQNNKSVFSSKINASESSFLSYSFISSENDKNEKYLSSDATSRFNTRNVLDSSVEIETENMNKSNLSTNSNLNTKSTVQSMSSSATPLSNFDFETNQYNQSTDSRPEKNDIQSNKKSNSQLSKNHGDDDGAADGADDESKDNALHSYSFPTKENENEMISQQTTSSQVTDDQKYESKGDSSNDEHEDANDNKGNANALNNSKENEEDEDADGDYETRQVNEESKFKPNSNLKSEIAHNHAVSNSKHNNNKNGMAVLDLMDFGSVKPSHNLDASEHINYENIMHSESRGIGRSFVSHHERAPSHASLQDLSDSDVQREVDAFKNFKMRDNPLANLTD